MEGFSRYLALAMVLTMQVQCGGKKDSPDVLLDSVPNPDVAFPSDIVLDQVGTSDTLLDGDSPALLGELLVEVIDIAEVEQTGCLQDGDCQAPLPYCHKPSGTCVECLQSPQCKNAEAPLCRQEDFVCVQCVDETHCPDPAEQCVEGLCLNVSCKPESTICVGNSVHMCSPDGTNPAWHITNCGDKTCLDGSCVWCIPDSIFCKDVKVVQCLPDGSYWETLETCESEVGCAGGQCCDCYPGQKRCVDGWVEECQVDCLSWELVEDCNDQLLTCLNGLCIDPCTNDVKSDSNAGCIFYAVDLDNALEPPYDAQNAQYAVIASNPSATQSVNVSVEGPNGEEGSAIVAPRTLHKFELPNTWGLDGTQHNNHLFKVTSSAPIIAYQFNPLSNVTEVFSNDASVLLPAPTLGDDYYVVSYGQLTTQFRGFFTVVAAANEPIEVTFTVTTETLAGDGIPALSAGDSHTMTLEPGELINVESDIADGDLSGTHVKATGKIAVFGGHEAANMRGACCADHLEQQLTPVAAWGTQYLVSKAWPRMKESDYVRVMASKENTQVTLTPGVDTVPLLAAGEYYTFKTTEHIYVTADHPIMVTQYLASSQEVLFGSDLSQCSNAADCPIGFTCGWWGGNCAGPSCTSTADCPAGTTCPGGFGGTCEAIGDPAMMLAVPKEQFMESYVFLIPDAYLDDYVNIVAPEGAAIYLDDALIPQSEFEVVGLSGLAVHRAKVEDGVHTVWSIEKFGIMVYGYDNDVSYGYPGGLGLADLTED
jgi:hypothetical protein